MTPALRFCGLSAASPSAISHRSFSAVTMISPSTASSCVLPESRADTRQICSWWLMMYLSSTLSSRRRWWKLEARHCAAASLARAIAARTWGFVLMRGTVLVMTSAQPTDQRWARDAGTQKHCAACHNSAAQRSAAPHARARCSTAAPPKRAATAAITPITPFCPSLPHTSSGVMALTWPRNCIVPGS